VADDLLHPNPLLSMADSASTARFMLDKDFNGEFSSVGQFVHCDGLVLLPTNTKVYLFNPATRETLTLPESNTNM
jgi:hypothetical protein